jgi:hypothetical protein
MIAGNGAEFMGGILPYKLKCIIKKHTGGIFDSSKIVEKKREKLLIVGLLIHLNIRLSQAVNMHMNYSSFFCLLLP